MHKDSINSMYKITQECTTKTQLQNTSEILMHKNYGDVLNENNCVYRIWNKNTAKHSSPKCCLQDNIEQITQKLRAAC